MSFTGKILLYNICDIGLNNLMHNTEKWRKNVLKIPQCEHQ